MVWLRTTNEVLWRRSGTIRVHNKQPFDLKHYECEKIVSRVFKTCTYNVKRKSSDGPPTNPRIDIGGMYLEVLGRNSTLL